MRAIVCMSVYGREGAVLCTNVERERERERERKTEREKRPREKTERMSVSTFVYVWCLVCEREGEREREPAGSSWGRFPQIWLLLPCRLPPVNSCKHTRRYTNTHAHTHTHKNTHIHTHTQTHTHTHITTHQMKPLTTKLHIQSKHAVTHIRRRKLTHNKQTWQVTVRRKGRDVRAVATARNCCERTPRMELAPKLENALAEGSTNASVMYTAVYRCARIKKGL